MARTASTAHAASTFFAAPAAVVVVRVCVDAGTTTHCLASGTGDLASSTHTKITGSTFSTTATAVIAIALEVIANA